MPIPLTVAHVDGIMAPRPRSAIEAFQRASGLTADGQVNNATLDRLGVQFPTEVVRRELGVCAAGNVRAGE